MLDQEEIKSIYNALLAESTRESGRARRRLDSGGPFEIWASLLFPGRHLAIELGPFRQEWLPSGWATRSIKGFRMHAESENPMPGEPFRLVLELQDNGYADEFSIFAASIASSVSSDENSRQAAEGCWRTLERWKDFFAEKRDSLSREQQVGLFGELSVLSQLAEAGLPLRALLDAWTGALRTDQDFQLKGAALEVKTTTAVDADRITIASARQLDSTGVEFLTLVRLALDERQDSGVSLPDLVDDLRRRAAESSPGAQVRLEEKLICAGYAERHRQIYQERGYSQRSIDFFHVGEGFPRFLESDLPRGVTGITYVLSLASCKSFMTTKDDVINKLREFCNAN